MKVVVSGGHHTTAFAVIDELKKHMTPEILWLGHKYSMWGDKAESAEYLSTKKRGYKFIDLKAGKFYRTYNPLKLLRIPFGFMQALYQVFKFKPDLILSFGGYLAVPVVLSGWVLRIPAVTHEQTAAAGTANQKLARFVRKVFITWEDSEKYFPKDKTVLTGNPLRHAVFKKEEAVYRKLKKGLAENKKTLYVTGGKQGAHVINEVIKKALPTLLKKYNVVHQCGRSTLNNDYEELSALKGRGYLLKDYFEEGEIGSVYALSDLIISRAGANTVYEITALGKVAIFIPFPWVPCDEQTKNAQILEKAGSAVILPQEDLTPDSLLEKIDQVFADFEKYAKSAMAARSMIKLDGAEKVVFEIKKIISQL